MKEKKEAEEAQKKADKEMQLAKELEEQKKKTAESTRRLQELEAQNNNHHDASNIFISEQLSQQEAAKQKAEKEAIEKITQATLLGIKKGEEASKKLHADAKVQSEEQTTKAIEKLKNKFDSTKAQVIAIVQNFGKIHSDLQELKQEYLQEQSNLQGYLQLSNMTIGSELSEHDAKVHELQSKVA